LVNTRPEQSGAEIVVEIVREEVRGGASIQL